jgi:pimeloyl-ACP methyl ester carboxylesterase
MFDIGHSRVPHYSVGRGPDLLLLHGWPLYSATFRHIVPVLAERYTCHLIDLPGVGDSEWGPESKISLHDHARCARTIIDRLAITNYAIVAQDSGAVVARLLAAFDTRVRGLVLGNTEIPGHHPWQLKVYKLLAGLPFGAHLFGAALRLRALRQSNLAYGGCFSDLAYLEGEFRELFIDATVRSRRALEGHARLFQDFDWSMIDALVETHAQLRAPVHFIWGKQDPYFPLAKLERSLSQFAGGASLTVIDPGKLMVHEEFPVAFATEARSFLDACFAGVLERASHDRPTSRTRS